jgi:hypothetical protein
MCITERTKFYILKGEDKIGGCFSKLCSRNKFTYVKIEVRFTVLIPPYGYCNCRTKTNLL